MNSSIKKPKYIKGELVYFIPSFASESDNTVEIPYPLEIKEGAIDMVFCHLARHYLANHKTQPEYVIDANNGFRFRTIESLIFKTKEEAENFIKETHEQ